MADFILKVRLGISDTSKNKKLISKFAEWLNQEYPKPSYTDLALEFIKMVLERAQLPFDGTLTTDLSHSAVDDYLVDLRHPKPGKNGKWFLDDLPLRNKSVVWIKLENQWIKVKVAIKDKQHNIIIEPENVELPLTENLFLHW